MSTTGKVLLSLLLVLGGSVDLFAQGTGPRGLGGVVTSPILVASGANPMKIEVANTYSSSINNETGSLDWQTTANELLIGSRTAATGTGRVVRFLAQNNNGGTNFSQIALGANSLPVLKQGYMTLAGANVSDPTAGTWFSYGNITHTGTSGTVVNTAITPTYNQSSGTASNTDLLINRTETATGSGAQNFVDFQRGGTSQFRVTSGKAAQGTQVSTAQATAPTCSTNCGTSPSVAGSDTSMLVTMGSSGVPASGWVVTFNGTWATRPACQVTMAKAGMVVGKQALTVVTTTTNLTVVTNGTAPATTDEYQITCIGRQ